MRQKEHLVFVLKRKKEFFHFEDFMCVSFHVSRFTFRRFLGYYTEDNLHLTVKIMYYCDAVCTIVSKEKFPRFGRFAFA